MSLFWLYDLPDWLLAVLVVGLSVALALAGYRATEPLRRHAANEVATGVLGAVGLAQGVLLALVAVAAWSNYTATGDAAQREAAALGNMYRLFEGYPEPARQRLQGSIRTYLELILSEEWPALQRGEPGVRAQRARDSLAREWTAFDPRTNREQVLYEATAREMERFLDARRARLAAGRAGLPEPLWAVAVLGGALTVACTYFFRTYERRVQLLMTSAVAASVGLLLYLILVLDHPVWGRQGMGPDPFAAILPTVEGHR